MDFDITPYSDIRDSLQKSGIVCSVIRRHQISVSLQDKEVWPNSGNSFWITHASGVWHLFTWTCVGYQIPNGTDIAELCRRCIAVGESAMYRVPDGIQSEFGLTELDENGAESVYAEMQTAR